MTEHQDLLTQAFPSENWELNKPLAELTYFKLGGPAEVYLSTEDETTAAQVIRFCSEKNIPVTYLSGASNVIVADAGIQGLVLQYKNTDTVVSEVSGDKHLFYSGAGLQTALVVRKSVDAGLTGLEYFLGVPGLLGGAVFNNAHYQHQLIGDHISRVQVITSTGEVVWLTQAECEFKYDYSRFHHTKELIIKVEFALKPGDATTSRELIIESTRKRASSQPLGEASSGCVFRNIPNTPELQEKFPQFKERSEVPASFLIDQAGFKGHREGAIEVSQKHAAFFINTGGGTSKDVLTLIDRVKTTIRQQYGVELKEEVFYLS